jgi:hypothetical protein
LLQNFPKNEISKLQMFDFAGIGEYWTGNRRFFNPCTQETKIEIRTNGEGLWG